MRAILRNKENQPIFVEKEKEIFEAITDAIDMTRDPTASAQFKLKQIGAMLLVMKSLPDKLKEK